MKNTRRKGTDQEFFLKTRKEWRKEKEEIFTYVEVPILMCSRLIGEERPKGNKKKAMPPPTSKTDT